MQKKVIAVAQYNGHAAKPTGGVSLSFKFGYAQLINVIQLNQFISNDVDVTIKQANKEPIGLGTYRVENISTNKNGDSVLKLNSLLQFVELDNVNKIISEELINVRFMSTIFIEDKEAGEENN